MATAGHNSGSKLIVRLHPSDNVVTARLDILGNTPIDEEQISSCCPIPSGHKLATRKIKAGEEIRKYDQVIGFACKDIDQGEHVHVHNVEMRDFDRDYQFCKGVTETNYFPESEQRMFEGFKRKPQKRKRKTGRI